MKRTKTAAVKAADSVKGTRKSAGSARGKAVGAAEAASPARKATAPAKAPPTARKAATTVARSTVATAAVKPKGAAKGSKAPAAKVKPDPVAQLRAQVIEGLERIKARDIREIDVRGRASFADLIVVASGTSTTHVKAIADEVIKHAKKVGTVPLGVEGAREAEWVLVDLGDIVVHVMLPRVREFYALERLWTVGAEESSATLSA